MSRDRIAVFFVLVLSCGVFFYFSYGLIVRLSILFFKGETSVEVIEWTKKDGKTYVIYEYLNQADNHNYTIEKEVKKTSIEELKSKNELTIKYSTVFPSFTLIDGMSDYSYVLILIGCVIALIAAYRSIQVLRRKIPMSKFT